MEVHKPKTGDRTASSAEFSNSLATAGVQGFTLGAIDLAHVSVFPWHLLVCSCGTGTTNKSTIAQQAYDALSMSAQIGSEAKLSIVDESGEIILFPPQESLPDYVRGMLEGPMEIDPLSVMNASHAHERKIAGVVVISSEPIRR